MAAVLESFPQAPAVALAQAELVVTDAVAALSRSLLDDAAKLGGWRQVSQADPEGMEPALRRYREYLDRVLDL
jgi:hypothetical protein